MKVLVSSTNSSSHVLWDNLLINLGLGNLYVCTDAIDTKNILLSKGLLPSQILSTEQPFYSLARIVLDYESSAKISHAPVDYPTKSIIAVMNFSVFLLINALA